MKFRVRFAFRLPVPAVTLAVLTMLALPGVAQTFSVLHTFTGGADGGNPYAGVTLGGPGTLYGTTYDGGTDGLGVVFKLVQRGSDWTLSPLYEFTAILDGDYPVGPAVAGPNGALYGTTDLGGYSGEGTLFELQPSPTACKTAICYWSETVLHSFDIYDGAQPFYVKLTFDQAGNIYGTTVAGGAYYYGTVFELSPSGGGWTESVLHSFNPNGIDGYSPAYGVIFDRAGNLYGTTWFGGTGDGGTVFELSPSGGTWTENILYNFPLNSQGGSAQPGDLIMDQSGNLYGAAFNGEDDYTGAIFELTPSGGSWSFSTTYTFGNQCSPRSLAMDTTGDLYGNCEMGGLYGYGWVFELTYSGGSWTLTDLHDFTGGSDGGNPFGSVVVDSSGNLYGTTQIGGEASGCPYYNYTGCGVVWEITGVAAPRKN